MPTNFGNEIMVDNNLKKRCSTYISTRQTELMSYKT